MTASNKMTSSPSAAAPANNRALINEAIKRILLDIVIRGHGERLIGRWSREPSLQAFLENVPYLLDRINQFHLICMRGCSGGGRSAAGSGVLNHVHSHHHSHHSHHNHNHHHHHHHNHRHHHNNYQAHNNQGNAQLEEEVDDDYVDDDIATSGLHDLVNLIGAEHHWLVRTRDSLGLTPLHKAVLFNNRPVVEFILDRYRDELAPICRAGQTAARAAAHQAQRLIDAQDKYGRTALHYAAALVSQAGRRQQPIELGAPNQRQPNCNPTTIAADLVHERDRARQLSLFKFLMLRGANRRLRDFRGKTAEYYLRHAEQLRAKSIIHLANKLNANYQAAVLSRTLKALSLNGVGGGVGAVGGQLEDIGSDFSEVAEREDSCVSRRQLFCERQQADLFILGQQDERDEQQEGPSANRESMSVSCTDLRQRPAQDAAGAECRPEAAPGDDERSLLIENDTPTARVTGSRPEFLRTKSRSSINLVAAGQRQQSDAEPELLTSPPASACGGRRPSNASHRLNSGPPQPPPPPLAGELDVWSSAGSLCSSPPVDASSARANGRHHWDRAAVGANAVGEAEQSCLKRLQAERLERPMADERTRARIRKCLGEAKLEAINELVCDGLGQLVVEEARTLCWNAACKRYVANVIPNLLKQLDTLHELVATNRCKALKALVTSEPLLTRLKRPYKRAAVDALQLAVQWNRKTIVGLLLGRFPELINQRDSHGATCLHWAARSLHSDRLYNWLSEHFGAQLERVRDWRGKTAADYRQQAIRLASFSHLHQQPQQQQQHAAHLHFCRPTATATSTSSAAAAASKSFQRRDSAGSVERILEATKRRENELSACGVRSQLIRRQQQQQHAASGQRQGVKMRPVRVVEPHQVVEAKPNRGDDDELAPGAALAVEKRDEAAQVSIGVEAPSSLAELADEASEARDLSEKARRSLASVSGNDDDNDDEDDDDDASERNLSPSGLETSGKQRQWRPAEESSQTGEVGARQMRPPALERAGRQTRREEAQEGAGQEAGGNELELLEEFGQLEAADLVGETSGQAATPAANGASKPLDATKIDPSGGGGGGGAGLNDGPARPPGNHIRDDHNCDDDDDAGESGQLASEPMGAELGGGGGRASSARDKNLNQIIGDCIRGDQFKKLEHLILAGCGQRVQQIYAKQRAAGKLATSREMGAYLEGRAIEFMRTCEQIHEQVHLCHAHVLHGHQLAPADSGGDGDGGGGGGGGDGDNAEANEPEPGGEVSAAQAALAQGHRLAALERRVRAELADDCEQLEGEAGAPPRRAQPAASLETLNSSFHKLSSLLQDGCFIMARDKFGASPLHVALVRADRRLLDYLLRRHPNVASAPDHDNRTALHYAAIVLAAYARHGPFKLTTRRAPRAYWQVAEATRRIYENLCARYGPELTSLRDRKAKTCADYLAPCQTTGAGQGAGQGDGRGDELGRQTAGCANPAACATVAPLDRRHMPLAKLPAGLYEPQLLTECCPNYAEMLRRYDYLLLVARDDHAETDEAAAAANQTEHCRGKAKESLSEPITRARSPLARVRTQNNSFESRRPRKKGSTSSEPEATATTTQAEAAPRSRGELLAQLERLHQSELVVPGSHVHVNQRSGQVAPKPVVGGCDLSFPAHFSPPIESNGGGAGGARVSAMKQQQQQQQQQQLQTRPKVLPSHSPRPRSPRGAGEANNRLGFAAPALVPVPVTAATPISPSSPLSMGLGGGGGGGGARHGRHHRQRRRHHHGKRAASKQGRLSVVGGVIVPTIIHNDKMDEIETYDIIYRQPPSRCESSCSSSSSSSSLVSSSASSLNSSLLSLNDLDPNNTTASASGAGNHHRHQHHRHHHHNHRQLLPAANSPKLVKSPSPSAGGVPSLLSHRGIAKRGAGNYGHLNGEIDGAAADPRDVGPEVGVVDDDGDDDDGAEDDVAEEDDEDEDEEGDAEEDDRVERLSNEFEDRVKREKHELRQKVDQIMKEIKLSAKSGKSSRFLASPNDLSALPSNAGTTSNSNGNNNNSNNNKLKVQANSQQQQMVLTPADLRNQCAAPDQARPSMQADKTSKLSSNSLSSKQSTSCSTSATFSSTSRTSNCSGSESGSQCATNSSSPGSTSANSLAATKPHARTSSCSSTSSSSASTVSSVSSPTTSLGGGQVKTRRPAKTVTINEPNGRGGPASAAAAAVRAQIFGAPQVQQQQQHNQQQHLVQHRQQRQMQVVGQAGPAPNSSHNQLNRHLSELTDQLVSKNTYGQTYLHFIASKSQSSSTLYKVLEHGKHLIGERDIFYRTARDVALQFSLPNNVQVLDKFIIDLFIGAQTNLLWLLLNQGYSPLIHVSDPDGNDIMLILKLLKQERMIHYLLQMADFQRWRDELHTFIRHGYSAGVSELIKKHRDLVRAKSVYSRTSLHLAVLFDRIDMISELIAMDPTSVQAVDNMGRTPLHYVYGLHLKNGEPIRDLLLSRGASLETRDVRERTPKYYYIFRAEIEEIRRIELELN